MGKNNHEELLGGAPEATSNKQTVEDNLLGRPHVAEKSFAPEAKKDALAPKTPEERFAELQRLTSVYLSEDDEAMLAKAFRFASEAHEGQCRKSGEPFVAHPVEVAIILADLRMDVETPVSYTHLDVYKRQSSSMFRNCSRARWRRVRTVLGRHPVMRAISSVA